MDHLACISCLSSEFRAANSD